MTADHIISTGLKHLGTPYTFNAKPFQTEMFDCSSFMQYIFYVNGVALPRNSRQQFKVGTAIPFSKLKKGDLLFFTTKKRRKNSGIAKVGHVALYIGEGKILHTYRRGGKVTISTLDDYWMSVFLGAKRVI